MTMIPPNIARRTRRGFAPEAVAHARQRYEDTDETQDSIAADLGVHRRTLDALAKREGWKLRKDRPPRALPPALKLEIAASAAVGDSAAAPPSADAVPEPTADAVSAAALASRLEAAVEKELRKVETLRSKFSTPAHRSIEAERTARTLATVTETLFKVRRLREAGLRRSLASMTRCLPMPSNSVASLRAASRRLFLDNVVERYASSG